MALYSSSGGDGIGSFFKFDTMRNVFDIHPNRRGMGVLARAYIYFIHSRWFNPMGY